MENDMLLGSQEYKLAMEAIEIVESIETIHIDTVDEQIELVGALQNVEQRVRDVFKFARQPEVMINSNPINMIKLMGRAKKAAARLYRMMPGNENSTPPQGEKSDMLDKILEIIEKDDNQDNIEIVASNTEIQYVDPKDINFDTMDVDKSF